MSIADELQNYADGLGEAYDAVDDMGGVTPPAKNMNNLDAAIRTIPQPVVNDGTLTIQKNGTTVQTFTANQASNATANITVPVNTSDLTNDSGFITSASLPTKTSDLTNDGSDGTSTYVEADGLATVATTGAYSDLSGTPTIPTATSDLTNDSGFITSSDLPTKTSDLTNDGSDGTSTYVEADDLATVATTGAYSDLSGTPTIPTATSDLTNDSGFITSADLPTKTSDLTNDGADGTSTYVEADDLATVATSGSYTDLTNTPTIPAAQVNSDWNASSGVAQILNKPTLATVATSGSYSDLSNTPTIPTATSDLTNDSGFITSSDLPTKTSDLTNDGSDGTSTYVEADDLANVATSGSYNDLSNTPTIPTATSDLTNDSGFITSASLPTKTSDLTNDGSDGTSTYVEADDLASVATTGSYTDLTNTPSIPAAQVNSDWNANSGVAEILNKPNLATVATTGAYSDLTGTPTIPTVNDATLTITQNGTSAGTFTANASSNTTIALTDTTYSAMTGASSGAAGTSGLVPAPAAGDESKVLSGAGTWVAQSGGGSTYTAGNGINISANDEISIDTSVVAELSDLPTVNDGTLTIQHNGTSKGTFTANQSTASTVNIETIYADTISPATAVDPITASMIAGGTSASTLANGALVEVVGTTTGSFNYAWKFADGRLMCFQKYTVTSASPSSWGSLYQAAFTPSNNYAVTFVADPSTNVFFEPQSSSSNSAWIMNTGGPSTTRPTEFFLVRPNNAAINGSIYVTAYGFWK